MAFYGYQPSNFYQPYGQYSMLPQPQPQQIAPQPQTTNRWEWVQGENGAKSYLVAPNTTVLLLDSEGKKFYLKSADASGMPLPLRTFEWTETTQTVQPTEFALAEHSGGVEYATKSDLDALSERLDKLVSDKRTERKVVASADDE